MEFNIMGKSALKLYKIILRIAIMLFIPLFCLIIIWYCEIARIALNYFHCFNFSWMHSAVLLTVVISVTRWIIIDRRCHSIHLLGHSMTLHRLRCQMDVHVAAVTSQDPQLTAWFFCFFWIWELITFLYYMLMSHERTHILRALGIKLLYS